MAATTLRPTINIKSSFTTIGAGFKKANKSVGSIRTILLKRTKVKRDAIAGKRNLFSKRIENQRRKDSEAVVEASKIGTGIGRIGNAVLNSGKGIFGRIVDFVGTLLVGWLVNNLPTIMTMAQDLMGRIQKTANILGNFVRDIGGIFAASTKVLGAVVTNITSLDFFDSQKRVSTALGDLESVFSDMNKQFDDGIKLLTTPLGQMTGETPVPPAGTDYTMPPEQVGKSGTGGQLQPIHKQALDIISGPESGGNYNAMNNGNSGDRPGGSKKWLGKNLTDMTIGEVKQHQNVRGDLWAAGRYQIIPVSLPTAQSAAGLKDSDMFDKNNQDLLGIGLLKVQGPGAWSKYSKYSKEEISIMYKAKDTPLGKSQAPQAPTPAKTSPSPSSTTTVQDQFKGKPGGAAGIITSERGWRNGRMHHGIDIAPAGPGYYVALKLSGTVDYIGFDAGGYGNFVDIKSENTIYRFAHLAKVFVKSGQSYNGQTIGEIGSTGGSTGIHLHFEVRPGGKNSIDPRPYLGLLSIGKTITGIPGQFNLAPGNNNITRAANQLNLPSTARAPQVMVMDDRPAPQPQQPQVASGGGSAPPMIDSENVLNNLMRNYLLLDLAYT